MTIEASNLTHEEYFRLNGALSTERTIDLLDGLNEAQAFDVREFAAYAQEAQAGFTAEDFLHETVSDLQSLCKRLRGDNRETLQGIIESLNDALQCQFNASDYGREQLHKIIKNK